MLSKAVGVPAVEIGTPFWVPVPMPLQAVRVT